MDLLDSGGLDARDGASIVAGDTHDAGTFDAEMIEGDDGAASSDGAVLDAGNREAGSIAYEGSITATAEGMGAIVVSAVAPASEGLYLLAVSSRPVQRVTGISGLGLSWSPLLFQCAGRNQTGVDVWWAIGSNPQQGDVTVTLAGSVLSVAVALSRYSGVRSEAPFGVPFSANTNASGVCTGGQDGDVYRELVPTVFEGSLLVAAIAHRNEAHTAGSSFTERTEVHVGEDGDVSGLSMVDGPTANPVTILDGSFGSEIDWAVAAVELRSQ